MAGEREPTNCRQEIKSRVRPDDPSKGMPKRFWHFLEDNMNAKLGIVLPVACVALFVSACSSGPQSRILGKWEVAGAQVGGVDDVGAAAAGKAIRMSAEFDGDGTAKVTMMGQTLQGTYKINGENELEWTMSGVTKKSKLNVTPTELELTDDANRTIKYKRR
jgi:hypothetical protein